MSFKSEIQIADSWRDNPLRFATKDEAIAYAYNLLMCHFLVRATRVVETDDPINYADPAAGRRTVRSLTCLNPG